MGFELLPPQGRGTAAIWARAAEGMDEAAFADFRRRFAAAGVQVKAEGDRIEISVEGLQGRMRLEADVAKGARLAREGGEPAAEDCLLWVNGREYGREILRDWVPAGDRK